MGGSIYFYYSPPASAKTLLEGEPTTTDDFVLKIADCNFESCEASCYGGAIHLSILDKELSKPIEINHCTFKYGKISNSESKNEDERGIGSSGEIYYQYKSTSASTLTGDALKIINCDFSRSEANDLGGSIYIDVDGASSKKIELKSCTFDESSSKNGRGVDVVSSQQTVLFKFTGCQFKWKTSINFKAISGEITGCDFTDLVQPIRYESNYDSAAGDNSPSLKIDGCTFKQTKDFSEINSLLYLVPKASSKFIFTNNQVDVTVDSSVFVIDCDSFTDLVGSWTFNDNTLTPKNKKQIKTRNALLIPADCLDFGFKCAATCLPNDKCRQEGSDEYETETLDISSSVFTNLKTENHGGCIYAKNWGLTGKGAHFEGCEAVTTEGTESKAGGGIYIYIDKAISPNIVSINTFEFTGCKAFYGGAIYAFCNVEDMTITIKSCTFTTNEASLIQPTSGDVNLFGGSAIFHSVMTAVIMKCKFRQNVGTSVKLYNVFAEQSGAFALSKAQKSSSKISINDCIFEANEKTSSSIFYINTANNKVPTTVVNCIFTGRLGRNARHIDGSISEVSSAAAYKNFIVKSCKFSEGLEKAINKVLVSIDANTLQFNYNENALDKSNLNANWKVILAPILAVMISVIVTVIKKKEDDSNGEDESIEA